MCFNLKRNQPRFGLNQFKTSTQSFFFFERERKKTVLANCVPRHTWPTRLVPVGPDHLSRGRRGTVAPRSTTSLQEGQSECPRRCARQQSLPPSQPRGLLWLVPHFAIRQRVEEREGLARPPAADFASHHQACPTVSLSKSGVGALFPNAGLGHGSPICGCAFRARRTVHAHRDTIVVSIAS